MLGWEEKRLRKRPWVRYRSARLAGVRGNALWRRLARRWAVGLGAVRGMGAGCCCPCLWRAARRVCGVGTKKPRPGRTGRGWGGGEGVREGQSVWIGWSQRLRALIIAA